MTLIAFTQYFVSATTCTPSPAHIKMMLQASDTLPLNFGFTGKGSTSNFAGMYTFASTDFLDMFPLFRVRRSDKCWCSRTLIS